MSFRALFRDHGMTYHAKRKQWIQIQDKLQLLRSAHLYQVTRRIGPQQESQDRSGGETNGRLLDRVFDTLSTKQSFSLVASDPLVGKPMHTEKDV